MELSGVLSMEVLLPGCKSVTVTQFDTYACYHAEFLDGTVLSAFLTAENVERHGVDAAIRQVADALNEAHEYEVSKASKKHLNSAIENKSFTPGPWNLHDAWDHTGGKVRFPIMGTESGVVLRTVSGGGMEASEADLTLMLRAHEMLLSLESLVKILTDEEGQPLVDMVTGAEIVGIKSAMDLIAEVRSVCSK